MAGTGPPAKFQGRSRKASVGPMALPAEGRKGRLPSWPLEGKPSSAERKLWADLWRTPQAVAWEPLGWTRVVARYARVAVAAERELTQHLMAEARQLEDRLGLTPKAMRMLLWTINPVDDAPPAPVVAPERWREAS